MRSDIATVVLGAGTVLLGAGTLALSWLAYSRDRSRLRPRATLALYHRDGTLLPYYSSPWIRRVFSGPLRRAEAARDPVWRSNLASGYYEERVVLTATNLGRRSANVDRLQFQLSNGLYRSWGIGGSVIGDAFPARVEPDGTAMYSVPLRQLASELAAMSEGVQLERVSCTVGWGIRPVGKRVPSYLARKVDERVREARSVQS